MAQVLIKKLLTRSPNLEVGAFIAMLQYYPWMCRRLDITTGKLQVSFKPAKDELPPHFRGMTHQEVREQFGTMCFNMGGGDWDQHGQDANKSLAQVCSLDMVLAEHDFLEFRPDWLRQIYELIRENDISGTSISRHKQNLRIIWNGLQAMYLKPVDPGQRKPHAILDFLVIAFCGIFEKAKQMHASGESIENIDIFTPEFMISGVELYAPESAEWFAGEIKRALQKLDQEWIQACRDLKKGTVRMVWIPALNRKIKVISVFSHSVAIGKAGRAAERNGGAGADVIIVRDKNNHVQWYTRDIYVKGAGGRYRLDLAPIAKAMRRAIAKRYKRSFAPDQNLEVTGFVKYKEGDRCDLYFPEYRGGLFWGALSNQEVAPCPIYQKEILPTVAEKLPECPLLFCPKDSNEWQRVAA